MPDFSCSAARDLPIDDGPSWDGPAAAGRMLDAAGIGGDSPNPERARRGFLIYDSANPELRGSYHLPFADMVDGRLTAIGNGLRAAASRLPQMNGLSDAMRASARAVLDQYMAKMNQKQAAREITRRATAAPPPSDNPFEYVMSDETVDRHGTVLPAAGWQLDNFKKNPIALFGHCGDFPIGNWRDVRVDGNRLIGRLELMPAVSERMQEIHAAVQAGVLRAVSVGFYELDDPMMDQEKAKAAGFRVMVLPKNELVECSLVAVPSNPNALQIARSLNLSRETQDLIFGEPAAPDRIPERSGRNPGKTAAKPSRTQRKTGMTTLSQRIEEAQQILNTRRDKLTELTAADELDVDAIEELNSQIEGHERALAALEASERRIGIAAPPAGAAAGNNVAAPHIRRPFSLPQRELSGLDLVVRAITARGIAAFGPGDKTIDRVLDERYPGHEPTAIITRADQTIGTTTVSGWASELVQQTWAGFLQALTGLSIYPVLRDRGIGLSFDGNGTVNVPSRTAGGAGGGFFAEGSPIRVGRVTTASVAMTSYQMGVIVPFSRKLAMQSTPSIESVVRQAILEDTASALDPILLDATASSTSRPAGLLYNISAAASGFGGGDYRAVQEDFKALLAPFISANAADNITVVMNSAQGLALSLMDSPIGNPAWFNAIRDRVNIVESTHATANRLVALRNSDFATALGDTPQFDISEQATVHMEDTTPLEIVSGTGPATADPVRSFWQTGTIGVRMIMDISWMMRRSGMVQWISNTTW